MVFATLNRNEAHQTLIDVVNGIISNQTIQEAQRLAWASETRVTKYRKALQTFRMSLMVILRRTVGRRTIRVSQLNLKVHYFFFAVFSFILQRTRISWGRHIRHGCRGRSV